MVRCHPSHIIILRSCRSKRLQTRFFLLFFSVTPRSKVDIPAAVVLSTPAAPAAGTAQDKDKDEIRKPAATGGHLLDKDALLPHQPASNKLTDREQEQEHNEHEAEVDGDTKCEHLPSGITVRVTAVTRRRRGGPTGANSRDESVMGAPLYKIKSVRAE